MNIIIILFVFVLVLFLYLHIFFHIKVSDDLEVFEVSNLSKERLEEVCDLRQPVTFYLNLDCFKNLYLENVLETYSAFDIKLRDISAQNLDTELFLPVVLHKANTVLKENKNQQFYSESNKDFLLETSLHKTFCANDGFLRPPMLMNTSYDYILGGINVTTPFRYDICYRNFFVVLDGSVSIKLTPPRNKKYLSPELDYDNFEFRSPINPWNVQEKYKNDFNKLKCLDVNLEKGQTIFIPAYWFYSIRFNSSNTTILNFKYRTYMNNMAIFPYIFKYYLQKQNIKHNIVSKIE